MQMRYVFGILFLITYFIFFIYCVRRLSLFKATLIGGVVGLCLGGYALSPSPGILLILTPIAWIFLMFAVVFGSCPFISSRLFQYLFVLSFALNWAAYGALASYITHLKGGFPDLVVIFSKRFGKR